MMVLVSRYLYRSERSLESLLDNLGHLNIDDKYLIKEHRDYLILVLLVVSVDLYDLCLNVRILLNQLLIVGITAQLLTFVLLCQFFLMSVNFCLGISVSICDSLSPLIII